MYAHQILDEFQNDMKTMCDCEDCRATKVYVETTLSMIKKSVHFYFGRIDKIIDFKQVGSDSYNKTEDFKIPYDICWFSYDTDPQLFGGIKKFGVVLKELENGSYAIAAFLYRRGSDRSFWDLFPVLTGIQENMDLREGIYTRLMLNYPQEEFDRDDFVQWWTGWIPKIVVISARLLNTKNIVTRVKKAPMKLNKKRKKKGKHPIFAYHTLFIKPTTGKVKSTSPKDLWKNPVHLCRGHFKTYTEENPLFGRVTGRFWWQPSVRGNKSCGVVHKDYVVEEQGE